MRFFAPKSFLKLILVGFVFVALPLIIALGLAALDVERISDQSQHAIYQAVRITRTSRALVEQIPAMERPARQWLVVADPALLRAYTQKHLKFQRTAVALAALPLGAAQKAELATLTRREQRLYDAMRAHAFAAKGDETKAADAFNDLATLARGILVDSSRLIDREVAVLQHEALRAQRRFLWTAVAFVPATVLFGVVFAFLLARPIRQIDQAIRRLGAGEFESAVEVAGPQDLRYLGRRLEWLRGRLLELEGEKNKFVRNVSHELKTPLTAIRESAELLAEEAVGRVNPAQREIITILRDNAVQLQRLIEGLLSFGLLHRRDSTLQLGPVDLVRILGEVAANHKPVILAKRLQLRTEVEAVPFEGDEAKLRTIVDNLLSNAVKYSPAGGVIRIVLRREDGAVVIEVHDAGPGVDAADRERIFEAFYQGRIAQRGRVRGTGLGLAIAREYAAAHSGEIRLLDAPAGGARFQVRLPLQPARERRSRRRRDAA